MNPAAAVPGGGLLIVKLVLSLGAVIGLILLLQKAARRWGHALGAGGGAETIRLLSQRSVGPRLSLAVVEVRGRTLLVGISPQGIHAVADLDSTAAPHHSADARGGNATAPREWAGAGGDGVASGPPSRGTMAPPADFASGTPSAVSAPPAPPVGGVRIGDAPAPGRGLLERFGFRPRGTARYAPVVERGAGRPAAPSPHRGAGAPLAFEEELMSRLASLRDSYPSLADVETDLGEARR